MRSSQVWLVSALLLAGAASDCLAASDSLSSARRRLNEVQALHDQRRYAAMESLATAVQVDLEKDPHPDTALLAEAWGQICMSRVLQRMVSDTVGVHAGHKSLELLRGAPSSLDSLR